MEEISRFSGISKHESAARILKENLERLYVEDPSSDDDHDKWYLAVDDTEARLFSATL